MNDAPQAPLISLVVIVKNGARTIGKTLESVRAQTFRDFECLVIDGASTDGTLDIVETYRDAVTTLDSRKDTSSYDAIVRGFGMARGTYVGLLSADDWIAPDAMEKIAAAVRACPTAGVVAFGLRGMHELPNGDFRPGRFYTTPPGANFTLSDALYGHGSSFFYRRDLLTQQNYYRTERYRSFADKEFYLRFGLLGIPKARV